MLFVCICEYANLECHHWPVGSYVTVGPSDWLADVEPTSDRLIGRCWTAGQNYDSPRLMLPVGQRSDRRCSVLAT